MSDKLKKFIQRSKTEFDQESPRPDLFDKIIEKVDHNKIAEKPKLHFRNSFQWMAVAASLLLLIVCSLFFYLSDDQIQNPSFQIADTPAPQIGKNTIRSPNPEELVEHSTLAQINKDTYDDRKSPSNSTTVLKPKINTITTIQQKVIENYQTENSIPSITNTLVQQAKTELKNEESISNPVNQEPNNKEVFAENMLQKEIKPSDAAAVSTTQEVVTSKSPNQIKEINMATSPSKDSATETIANEDTVEEESPSLKSSIKKGFFKLLSKKARKWSGNTLTIRNLETNDQSVLAVRYKDERIEFSKSFNLGPSN